MLRSNTLYPNHNHNHNNNPSNVLTNMGTYNRGPENNGETTTTIIRGKGFSEHAIALQLAAEANHKAEEGDHYRAIELYGQAIQRFNQDCRFYLNRCYCYAQLELYQLALDDAKQAIKLQPNWAKCYYRKGQALFGLGKHEEAEDAFKEVLLRESHCKETEKELFRVRCKAYRELGLDLKSAEEAAKRYDSIKDGIDAIFSNTLYHFNLRSYGTSNPSDQSKRDISLTDWTRTSANSMNMGNFGMMPQDGYQVPYFQPVVTGVDSCLTSVPMSNGHHHQRSSDYIDNSSFNGVINNSSNGNGNSDSITAARFGINFNNTSNNSNGCNNVSSQHQLISNNYTNNNLSTRNGENKQRMLNLSSPIDGLDMRSNLMVNKDYHIGCFNTFNHLPDSKLIEAIVPNLVSSSSSPSSSSSSGALSTSNEYIYVNGETFNQESSQKASDTTNMVQEQQQQQQHQQQQQQQQHQQQLHQQQQHQHQLLLQQQQQQQLQHALINSPNIDQEVQDTSINGVNFSINEANGCALNNTQQQCSPASSNNSNSSLPVAPPVSVQRSNQLATSPAPTSYSDIVKRAKKATTNCTKPIRKYVNTCNSPTMEDRESVPEGTGSGTSSLNGVVNEMSGKEEREANGCESPTGEENNAKHNNMSPGDQGSNSVNSATPGSNCVSNADLSKMKPTNVWAYNGLRVANVSNSCSKSTLNSIFSKFGRVKLIERINKSIENSIWVYYDNPVSPVEAAHKLQGAVIEGVSMSENVGLRIYFAPTDDQKDLKFSRPKQPPDNKGECYYWRTTNCFSREQCPLLHIPANKNIDAQIWMGKMNKESLNQSQIQPQPQPQQQQQQSTSSNGK